MYPLVVFVAVILLLVGVAQLSWLGRLVRDRRRVAGAGAVTCAEALRAGGRTVRVEGVAEPVAGQPPAGPLSGTPAAWCYASVTYQYETSDNEGDTYRQTGTLAEMRGDAFAVRDRTGAVLVDAGAGLTWHGLRPTVRERTWSLPAGVQPQVRAETAASWPGRACRRAGRSGGPASSPRSAGRGTCGSAWSRPAPRSSWSAPSSCSPAGAPR